MPIQRIDDLLSPLLDAYRDVRTRNWTQGSGIFIAEGESLVNALLSSRFGTQSVLIDEKYLGRFENNLPQECDCLVLPRNLVAELLGFNFHRGMMACGQREARRTLRDLPLIPEERETICVLVGVQDPENIGCILRTCAGLGVRRVVIGPGCCDPFSRRALRVSMGNTFRLDLLYSTDIFTDLAYLRERDVTTVAACLTESAESLHRFEKKGAVAILVGNERKGLPQEVIEAVDRQVQIEMELGTSSLNVAVASGILLHHFCRIA